MKAFLLHTDKALFGLLNGQWHNEWLDALMPFVRNPQFWYPLYLFMVLLVLSNFTANRFKWVLFAIATTALTNFVSSDLIKENIIRLRPCNDPAMADTVRFLLNYRPQSSSFTSSHAANHFGMAAFIYFTLKNYIGRWGLLFFVWATLIIYAQVYVGVHYPIDVLSGAIIGFLLGSLSAKLFTKFYRLS